jgi:hypothetical protein
MVAVLADPVFDKNDERVTSAKNVKRKQMIKEEPQWHANSKLIKRRRPLSTGPAEDD